MGDSESESEAPRVKLRPIVRLGMFLISHSHLLSVVCCTAGVLTLLLLPLLAKNTYISENALMPGSANPMLSSQEVSEANGLVKDLTNLDLKPMASGMLKNDGGSDIRSIYNALWRSCAVTFPWKSIWGAKAPRRVSFFVWMAAWGRFSLVII